MKRIIFLAVFVTLLSGFGVSHGTATFMHRAYASDDEVENPQEKLDSIKEEKEKKEQEAVDPDAHHPEFAYIQLESVTLPIITAKGLTQQISIGLSLEVPYEKKAAIAEYKPRLLDAYIQDLYGAIGAGFGLMRSGVVDVQQIKQRVAVVTGKVLGPDLKVHDVLLHVVQQQPK